MKTLTKIICLGAATLSLLSLAGCGEMNRINQQEKIQSEKYSCAKTLNLTSSSEISTITGDYNEDGHLDFIITKEDSGFNFSITSYLWLGDGKGNFKLKENFNKQY